MLQECDISPEILTDWLNNLYGNFFKNTAILQDARFTFSRTSGLDKIVEGTERKLLADMERMKKKVIKAWEKYAKDHKLSKEVKLQGEDEAARVVIKSTTGRELTVTLVEGTKRSFLFGFKELAKGLGFKDGDEGAKGTFRFDHMPEDAFRAAKKSAAKISDNTINMFMKGQGDPRFVRLNVRDVVRNGIREGKTATEISEGIANVFDEMTPWKVAEITRTEVPNAYNFGRIEASEREGITRARIDLGGRPCPWCIANGPAVRTMKEAKAYFDDHHPNNDCTLVPIIDYEKYGIEPPPGYSDREIGPLRPPTELPTPGVPGPPAAPGTSIAIKPPDNIAALEKIEEFDIENFDDQALVNKWKLHITWFNKSLASSSFKFSKEEVIKSATKIVEELFRRNKYDFNPKRMSDIGLKLINLILKNLVDKKIDANKHADRIFRGKEKAVVLDDELDLTLTRTFLLTNKNKKLGFVRFGWLPDPIEKRTFVFKYNFPIEEFKQFEKITGVSQSEIKRIWPKAESLWLYPVREFFPFK